MRHQFARLSAISLFILFIIAVVAPALQPATSAAQETQDERVKRINREIAEKGDTWVAGKTRVGGLSQGERQQLLGYKAPTVDEWAKVPKADLAVSADLPTSFDWRALGGVTPAKDQGGCGSCWAFAAVGQLEAFAKIYDQRILDLSEQAVLDCDPWDGGCGGGWVAGALELFISDGAVSEQCIPYVAYKHTVCTMSSCEILAGIDDWYGVSTAQIKQAVYDYGPISVGMFAHDYFSNYISGCYGADYSDTPNHAVLIVGWDDNVCGGEGAWIIKNSWGEDWGMNGFGYVKYGVCSIGSSAYLMDYHESDVLVHLDSPNDGENLSMGGSFEILWTTGRQIPDSISLLLSLNSGVSYDSTIVSGLPGASVSYTWTVPELPVPSARVKVVAYLGGAVGGWDESDADFRIVGPPYRYVSPTGGNIFPYTLPRWAATKIQTAVSAANPGDSILVEGATYNEAVTAQTAVVLLGGWNADFTERDPATNVTTITNISSAVSFMNTYDQYCGIDGFTIYRGRGREAQLPQLGSYGGGIFSYRASPVITNNIISECGSAGISAFSGGGGISCHDGNVVIENNIIESSLAQSGGGLYAYRATVTARNNRITGSRPNAEYTGAKNGGGIYALYSTIVLENNVIEGNTGYRYGGGIYSYFSDITIAADTISSNAVSMGGGGICTERSELGAARAVIVGNTSAGQAGGIYHKWARFDVANSVVALNEAAFVGGGVYADSAWGTFNNNTIDGNSAVYAGGNIFLGSSMETTDVRNNLITHGSGYGLQATNNVKVTIRYNDIFGNSPGETFMVTVDSTNISRDPRYADRASMDYHPALHSGAIDTGDPGGPFDPDGSRADIGAFGGPGAAFAAPDFVPSLSAAAAGDSLIHIEWTAPGSPGIEYYAVYAAGTDGFAPDEGNFIGLVAAGTTSFDHHPVAGCDYYRVSAANLAGYAGGYSPQAGACAGGEDTTPPSVTVIYPNGGEFIETGDTVMVRWAATDGLGIDSVSIWFSEDNGAGYARIAGGEPNDSIFVWIAPSSISDSCLIMVRAYDPSLNEGFDASDGVFSVKDITGVGDGDEEEPATPVVYSSALEQNYPNPFNGLTTIAYTIGERCRVELSIFDPAGRLVRGIAQGEREPGRYTTAWNGKDNAGRSVSSGVYFCRIKAGKFRQTRKIVYMR